MFWSLDISWASEFKLELFLPGGAQRTGRPQPDPHCRDAQWFGQLRNGNQLVLIIIIIF